MKLITQCLMLLMLFIGSSLFSFSQVLTGDKNAVQRIYMNIAETEKISLNKNIDDYMTSFSGVAKITQITDKTLLIEAIRAGRTTITVISGDDIYRYHLSTFEDRGAEQAQTNNEFTEKGYTQLTARFDKVNRDQMIIEGKAESQEQLDDAVQIGKKYTPYVVLKATIISTTENEEEVSTPEEREIEKTIERIAAVPGLKVKVKFEMRQKETNITESATTGNPIVTSTNTTSSGASTSTTAPLLPSDGGGNEPAPVKGTLEQSTVTQLEGVPAKIFLFGRVKDDLARAQAIRVARTFCQLVVSFLTVDDPIQVRFQAWILDVNLTKARRVGVNWPSSLSYRALQGAAASTAGGAATTNPLGLGATSAATVFSKMFSGGGESVSPMQNITAGLNTNVDVAVQILETEGVSKVIQAPVILVANGQYGYFSSGGQIPILETESTTTSVAQNVTYRTYGVQMSILPLNLERSGPGGTTEDVLNSDGTRSIPTMMDAKALINPVGRNNFTLPPEIDDSLKMVDEKGNIGIRVNINISDIDSTRAALASGAPSLITKASQTRAILRDQQPLVISGIYQKQFAESERKVPFLGDIPLIGGLFKDKNLSNDDIREVVVVLKPTIVRMGEGENPTTLPESRTNTVQEMMKQMRSDQNSTLEKPALKPYQSTRVSSKVDSSEAKNQPSVEQVPLIDVTPVAPQVDSLRATPHEVDAPHIASEPTLPQEPVSVILKDEAPAVIPVNGPQAPTTSNVEKAPETTSEEGVNSDATRMKEGPKTRIRPEAPDDAGVIQDQPQTRTESPTSEQQVKR